MNFCRGYSCFIDVYGRFQISLIYVSMANVRSMKYPRVESLFDFLNFDEIIIPHDFDSRDNSSARRVLRFERCDALYVCIKCAGYTD